MFDQRREGFQLRKPSPDPRNQVSRLKRLIEADLSGRRIFLNPVDARQTDSPLRYIDDPADRQIVFPVIYRLQIT